MEIAVGQRWVAVGLLAAFAGAGAVADPWFIAMASVVCASRLIEPKLIAPWKSADDGCRCLDLEAEGARRPSGTP